MTKRLILLLTSIAFGLVTLTAQVPRDVAPAQTGTAGLAGTVVSEPDGPPLRNAMVHLSGSGLEPGRATLTDEAGRFSFTALPPGNVTLMAYKPAYVPATYGQKRPGRGPGVGIALAAGQQISDVVIRVARGSVITGTIRDESGTPRRGLTVTVQPVRLINGERRLTELRNVASWETGRPTTDDRGVFRAYGLPPGEYVVSASLPMTGDLGSRADLRRLSPQELQWANAQLRGRGPGSVRVGIPAVARSAEAPGSGPRVGAVPVYFPGTPALSAAVPIVVGLGEERAGVDFVVGYVPAARVEGRVLGPDGRPVAGATVALARTPMAILAPVSVAPVGGGPARSGGDGTFSLANVPPGTHRILVRNTASPARGAPAPVAGERLWANVDVSVSGEDLTNLTVTLQPGATLRGRLLWDAPSSTQPPDARVVRVSLPDVPGSIGPLGTAVREDGSFELTGVTPGKYRLNATISAAPGNREAWLLKSATIGGRDAADTPFDVTSGGPLPEAVVTLSDQAAEISGTLFDAAGRPTADYVVVLFSTDRNHWYEGSRRLRSPVKPSSNGVYRLSRLPAGTYYLAALTDVDQEDLYDRDFLEQLAASALTIAIGDGEKKVQDLKLAGR